MIGVGMSPFVAAFCGGIGAVYYYNVAICCRFFQESGVPYYYNVAKHCRFFGHSPPLLQLDDEAGDLAAFLFFFEITDRIECAVVRQHLDDELAVVHALVAGDSFESDIFENGVK